MYGGISGVPRGIHDIQTCYTLTSTPLSLLLLDTLEQLHVCALSWFYALRARCQSLPFLRLFLCAGMQASDSRWSMVGGVGDQLFTVDLRARYVTPVQSHRYVTPDAPEPHNATATKPPHHMAHGHLFHQNGPYSSNLGLKVYYSSTFTFSPWEEGSKILIPYLTKMTNIWLIIRFCKFWKFWKMEFAPCDFQTLKVF